MDAKLIIETLRELVNIQRRQHDHIERVANSHYALCAALRGDSGTDTAPMQLDAAALARAADAIQELERMFDLPGTDSA